ncbi:hypothetical protein [Sphingobacterium multivorum]|uniref:hypothetical protein n=1 Tax=Sphingobacterium multivorum TaxID=28454 RepID=UPI0028AD027F|nr:hypothetical protein [Sphingobacterium multivorum]
MLKKIWKDPVGSAIIAAIILTVGAFMISLIYGLATDKPVKDLILDLWNLKISLGYTLVVFFLIVVASNIFKKLMKSKPSKIERLEKDFHDKFRKIVDEENKITYRFNAYISDYTGYPFISDLRIYCTNHDSESLFIEHGGCRRAGCKNYGKGYDESIVKQEIETSLLKAWEDMKSYNQ